MSTKRSGGGPDDGQQGSWTSETLPIAVRKELLERELNKLGFRKADTGRTPAGADSSASQQETPSSSHPSAEGEGEHAA